jgi:hypothetical protein
MLTGHNLLPNPGIEKVGSKILKLGDNGSILGPAGAFERKPTVLIGLYCEKPTIKTSALTI